MSEAASFDAPGSAAHSGAQLAAARRSCNLSIADVAHQLKLSPAQVEAMEAGEYQRLPGAVFVRGFIRNYARLLKLDPEPLVAQAEQRLPPPPQVVVETLASPDIPFPTRRGFKWKRYALAALLVVSALALFEYYGAGTDGTPEISVSSRAVAPSPAPAASPDQPFAPEAVPPAVTAVEPSAQPADKAGESAIPGGKSAAALKGAGAVAASEGQRGEHSVRLVFDRESWVEIRDRDGRRIFSKLNPAGSTQTVSGAPPLTVVVGNAAGVRLTHNDRPVDLAPYIDVDVARLTLK